MAEMIDDAKIRYLVRKCFQKVGIRDSSLESVITPIIFNLPPPLEPERLSLSLVRIPLTAYCALLSSAVAAFSREVFSLRACIHAPIHFVRIIRKSFNLLKYKTGNPRVQPEYTSHSGVCLYDRLPHQGARSQN